MSETDKELEEFNKLFDKLEPMPYGLGMDKKDVEILEISCLYSYAVSLKRIADVLTSPEKRRSFGK